MPCVKNGFHLVIIKNRSVILIDITVADLGFPLEAPASTAVTFNSGGSKIFQIEGAQKNCMKMVPHYN